MPATFRHLAQSLLRKTGLLNRARHSWLYDAYWSVANPALLKARDLEVAFYRQLLRNLKPGGLIFDIGANHGYKTDIFLRLGASVLSVDPDDLNQRTLRESFIAKRIQPKPVTIVGKALSDKIGKATLWVNAPGSALNTLDERWVDSLREDETRFGGRSNFGERKQVETTTLDQLIEQYGRPVFVKIDVEGHELAVLKGLSAPVPMLSFEVKSARIP